MEQARQPFRWFVPGDINGFFGLFFDNLTVLSFLSGILIFVYKFPAEIVYTRMFPGTALGVLVGDVIYTLMAYRLAKRTGKSDVTAMPLGLDTPSTIGLALVVLGPAFTGLKVQGLSENDAAMMTWYIGMATMIYMGILKVALSFVGGWVQRIVPAAGLLGSLAGIALGMIGISALFEIFANPVVGLVSLGVVLYAVVAEIRLPLKIPGVFASVMLGTILYYLMGWITKAAIQPPIESVHFYAPLPTMGIFKGFGPALKYLPLAIPFGLLTVIGGINVNESARLAGDEYNTRDILLTEAIATLIAGLCGGVAQSTPYIGHPAYKNMGARIGYTLLTGICIGLGGFFGQISFVIELIPRAALAPILVFVALDIVIQSFHAVPKKHAAAVAFSFFPSIARMLGIELSKIPVIPEGAVPELQTIVALGNGFIITAMLWGGFLAKLIDRNLKGVTIYLLILAGLSFFGIIHSALGDGSMYLPWKLPDAVRQVPYFYSLGYFVLAVLLLGIHLVSSKFPDPELPEPH